MHSLSVRWLIAPLVLALCTAVGSGPAHSAIGLWDDSPIATRGATAGSRFRVNPTRGTQNCVNCTIAGDSTLAGARASALPGGPTSIRCWSNSSAGSSHQCRHEGRWSRCFSTLARGLVGSSSGLAAAAPVTFSMR